MSAKNNTQKLHEKIARLDEMIAWFESDKFELDAALERFEEAKKVASEIDEQLTNYKNTITVIKKDFARDE